MTLCYPWGLDREKIKASRLKHSTQWHAGSILAVIEEFRKHDEEKHSVCDCRQQPGGGMGLLLPTEASNEVKYRV